MLNISHSKNLACILESLSGEKVGHQSVIFRWAYKSAKTNQFHRPVFFKNYLACLTKAQ